MKLAAQDKTDSKEVALREQRTFRSNSRVSHSVPASSDPGCLYWGKEKSICMHRGFIFLSKNWFLSVQKKLFIKYTFVPEKIYFICGFT